jgi:hypothetical protein
MTLAQPGCRSALHLTGRCLLEWRSKGQNKLIVVNLDMQNSCAEAFFFISLCSRRYLCKTKDFRACCHHAQHVAAHSHSFTYATNSYQEKSRKL